MRSMFNGAHFSRFDLGRHILGQAQCPPGTIPLLQNGKVVCVQGYAPGSMMTTSEQNPKMTVSMVRDATTMMGKESPGGNGMITMARIQGLSLGHPGWQRPIFPLALGQDGTPAPSPAPSPTPPAADFAPTFPAFPAPIYPPIYNYPVVTPTPPVVVEAPKETNPNWLLIAAGVAAGVALTLILT